MMPIAFTVGRTPGPRPTPSSAFLPLGGTLISVAKAGPGGPARTRGSAPLSVQNIALKICPA
jgi:hypothetical protein